MVLLRRESPNKIETFFHHHPFKVVDVSGPMLVLESGEGRIFRRNVSQTRPYLLPSDGVVGIEDHERTTLDTGRVPEEVVDPLPTNTCSLAPVTTPEGVGTPECQMVPERMVMSNDEKSSESRKSNRQRRAKSYLQDYIIS